MRNTAYLVIFCVFTLWACSKSGVDSKPDNHPAGVPTSAETKPQFNNSSFGVYKGVLLGSSGFIVLRINNGDNVIKGYMLIDNLRDTLSTSQTLTAGQPIVGLRFNGRFSSMTLSASSDGSNAQITDLVITGHPNPVAIIVHENAQQVLLYEGTLAGDLVGRINFIKVGTAVRSEPVEFIAKISTDNIYLGGHGIAESDSGRTHTHYIYDKGNPVRAFSGYPTFNLSVVTGPYVSYVNNVGAFRGTLDCRRVY